MEDVWLTTENIQQILDDVTFPGWRWDLWLLENEHGEHLLRGAFERPDRDTGKIHVGYSRQEFLPYNSTPDTIVKTAWVLVKLTIEHEAMEFFTYRGKRVFDPHTPVNRLIALQEA